uniref:Uncharacterized protein n=1 Tax=Phakopsora pachyrhizi TaxID=170000 RepID=A0A0S1MJU1_PHAPC
MSPLIKELICLFYLVKIIAIQFSSASPEQSPATVLEKRAPS